MEKITCSNCVLHSRVPNVTIDDQGLCSDCTSGITTERARSKMSAYFTKKMWSIVDEVKQKKWIYDAIVLVSGGKDSAFLLNYVKNVLGLRPLAYSCVHPVVNKHAAENMEKIASKLGIELLKFHPDEEVFKKIMHHALISSHEYGMDENAGCSACGFVTANTSLMVAIRMNIPLVFTGLDVDQSETPFLFDRNMIRERFQNNNVMNSAVYEIAKQALGKEYEKSIYQYDWDDISAHQFPALIAPLTFVDYDFRENYKLFEKLGLDANSFNTVLTNCDLVPFLSYISLRNYDCLTYIRHYANEIRKGYPYFMQSKSDYAEAEALSKETIEQLIQEYEAAINFVVDNDVDSANVTNSIKKEILALTQKHMELYGPQVCDAFFKQIIKINEYGRYFGIELKKINHKW